MDHPLQLEQYTSAQLAEIIVAAGLILKERSVQPADDSNPTNKIPPEQKIMVFRRRKIPWAKPSPQEAGQGCSQKKYKSIFSIPRTIG